MGILLPMVRGGSAIGGWSVAGSGAAPLDSAAAVVAAADEPELAP